MCGRYAITSPPEAIRRLFAYDDQPNFPQRYNVAPTQPVPVVRLVAGRRAFALLRWGLIPSWVEDPRTFALLINARGETLDEKPAFRAALRHRRCLVPADGFYEWRREGRRNTPYFVRLKRGGPMAFAGLWENWTGPNGEEMETLAIVTTTANRALSAVHTRMPVIVRPDAFDLWLDCANVDAATAAALITPAPEELLEAYEVSPAVNRVANDDPSLIERATAALEVGPAVDGKTAADKKSRRKPAIDNGQGSLF